MQLVRFNRCDTEIYHTSGYGRIAYSNIFQAYWKHKTFIIRQATLRALATLQVQEL